MRFTLARSLGSRRKWISDGQGCNESSGAKRSPAVASAPSPRPSGCRQAATTDRHGLRPRAVQEVGQTAAACTPRSAKRARCPNRGELLRSRHRHLPLGGPSAPAAAPSAGGEGQAPSFPSIARRGRNGWPKAVDTLKLRSVVATAVRPRHLADTAQPVHRKQMAAIRRRHPQMRSRASPLIFWGGHRGEGRKRCGGPSNSGHGESCGRAGLLQPQHRGRCSELQGRCARCATYSRSLGLLAACRAGWPPPSQQIKA